MFGGDRDGNTGAERKAPDHDAVGGIARRRESVGRGRVLQQPLLARRSRRSRIAAKGQRDQTGAVGGDALEAADTAGEEIAIAVEKQNDGTAGLGRHMPDDDLLAVGGGEHMFLGLGKTGGGGAVRPTGGIGNSIARCLT